MIKPQITLADFQKLDVRVGTIISAERVTEADKLLKLVIDLGEETKQIMAGIAEFYPDPKVLVGQQVPLLVNLEPRLLRGYESQGMMLAAETNNQPILLHPSQPVPSGSTIR